MAQVYIFYVSLEMCRLDWNSCVWCQVFPHLVPVLLPAAQMALTGSVYTTLAVGLERLVAVSRPHYQAANNNKH